MRSICCWSSVRRYHGGDESSVSNPWNTYTRPSDTPRYMRVLGSIWIFSTPPEALLADTAPPVARDTHSSSTDSIAIFRAEMHARAAPPTRACAGFHSDALLCQRALPRLHKVRRRQTPTFEEVSAFFAQADALHTARNSSIR